MFKNFLLCFANTGLLVAGQLLFKYGTVGKTVGSLWDLLRLLFSPIIIAALFFYGVSTMLWIYILSKIPLSFAYPVQALAFPIVLVLSMLLFKENVTLIRWLGISLIVCGVALAVAK